jgi:bifunctional enzyme CysN/CysC
MSLGAPPKKLINDFLEKQANLDTLRFITCGSVDDGKSTLIGRLLYEAGTILDDQLNALKADSKRHGTQGGEIDFALLVDGLAAEREQGITIDVAYRFFSTDRRKFIIIDTPGHEQYTRNMVTGASNADVAIILVDARKGLLTQTRRHSKICAALGIKNVVLAINKMDLVSYQQERFAQIKSDYAQFAVNLSFDSITPIPLSGIYGDNIIHRSKTTNWYDGPTLMGFLESVDINTQKISEPLRLPIQLAIRPNLDFRGFSGTIEKGTIEVGQNIKVLPSGETAKVQDIIMFKEKLERGQTGQAVTVTLDREIDVSRGDIIVPENDPCEVADQFELQLVWMDREPGYIGREYIMKIGTITVNAQITNIKHKIDIDTNKEIAGKELELNDFSITTIKLNKPIPYESSRTCSSLGSLILIDKVSYRTIACGMINFALRRANNIHQQKTAIDQSARNKLSGHTSKVIWFTGLSGAGKSTIANALEMELYSRGVRTYLLDGDNIRHGLNGDLGFTDADRIENIRRISEVAKLMVDAGLVVLTAFISPFDSERKMARSLFKKDEFIEIHVSTPLQVAEARDPKGLYKKARAGNLPNFTGVDSRYEAPANPDITIDTSHQTIAESVDHILCKLKLD